MNFEILINIYLIMGILYAMLYGRHALNRFVRLLKENRIFRNFILGDIEVPDTTIVNIAYDIGYAIDLILRTLLFPLYLPLDIKFNKWLNKYGF